MKKLFVSFLISLIFCFSTNICAFGEMTDSSNDSGVSGEIQTDIEKLLYINKEKIVLKNKILDSEYAYKFTITNISDKILEIRESNFSLYRNLNSDIRKNALKRTGDRFPFIWLRPINLTVSSVLMLPVVIICPFVILFLEDSGPMRNFSEGMQYYLMEPMEKTVGFPYYTYKDIKTDMDYYSVAKDFDPLPKPNEITELQPWQSIEWNVLFSKYTAGHCTLNLFVKIKGEKKGKYIKI